MRLESFQNDIRWYLKDDIWYEEHGQGGIILSTGQFQILLETEHGRVGDIGPVEEGQQIHETEDGYHAKIDLGDKSALGGYAHFGFSNASSRQEP